MISRNHLALALCLALIPSAAGMAISQTSRLPKMCLHDCKIGSAGYTLIKSAEGYSPFVYKDSIGVPTVGFGHALLPGEKIKTPLMGNDALSLLEHDLLARTARLNKIIAVPLTSNQFDAISSFAYNVGLANLERSTLLRKVNAGDDDAVPPQFLLWDKAGGHALRGLYLRRKAEANLYDDDEDFAEM